MTGQQPLSPAHGSSRSQSDLGDWPGFLVSWGLPLSVCDWSSPVRPASWGWAGGVTNAKPKPNTYCVSAGAENGHLLHTGAGVRTGPSTWIQQFLLRGTDLPAQSPTCANTESPCTLRVTAKERREDACLRKAGKILNINQNQGHLPSTVKEELPRYSNRRFRAVSVAGYHMVKKRTHVWTISGRT